MNPMAIANRMSAASITGPVRRLLGWANRSLLAVCMVFLLHPKLSLHYVTANVILLPGYRQEIGNLAEMPPQTAPSAAFLKQISVQNPSTCPGRCASARPLPLLPPSMKIRGLSLSGDRISTVQFHY